MNEPIILPNWYKEHVKEKGGLNVTGFSWIVSRPEKVQKILLQFPPACVVRVKKGHEDEGYIGVSLGVIGGDSEFPTIRVASEPGMKNGVEYRLEDLEVIGFWNGVTPEVVQSIIDAKVPQQIVNRAGEKIGRNDPCPCNSGKKFKRCCGSVQEATGSTTPSNN